MTSDHEAYEYSTVADEQLVALETGPDARLYNALVDVCEAILDDPGAARERAAAIATDQGIRFRSPVPGAYPYKVFWSLTDDGTPRIEAVFPYP